MLNELVYCPRLFHLEWVQGEFERNAFVADGQAVHSRVDTEGQPLAADDAERPKVSRSVDLSSARLGLTGKIDLVESEGGEVRPVDYKRGKKPDVPEGAWEPERVQLCAYGLLLREHGFTCRGGVLYFAGSRQRVELAFDDALVARTLGAVEEARRAIAALPPPLVASSKCGGCSLNGICLPDETNLLTARGEGAVRAMWTRRDNDQPLYVQGQGFRVGVDHDVLAVKDRDGKRAATARLGDTSHVVLQGNVQVSAQALAALFERDIPVAWMSYGGWLSGMAEGLGHRNIELRRAQFRAADEPARCLAAARALVRNKILNHRTLLRRSGAVEGRLLRSLAELASSALEAASLERLLGLEGTAARFFFEGFREMLCDGLAFDFERRNRRPPADPINALLSFAATLLAKDVAIAVRTVGLDPFLGFYHQPRYGRPALALDLMEPFRPLVCESVVLTAVNTGVVTREDFVSGATGVALNVEGRRRFLRAYERRMGEELSHPVFGYRLSYRRTIEVHVRLFARWLMGELPEPPELRTR